MCMPNNNFNCSHTKYKDHHQFFEIFNRHPLSRERQSFVRRHRLWPTASAEVLATKATACSLATVCFHGADCSQKSTAYSLFSNHQVPVFLILYIQHQSIFLKPLYPHLLVCLYISNFFQPYVSQADLTDPF